MTSSTDSAQKYYLPEGMPAPAANVDGLEAPFWEATQRHQLLVQRCNDCQTYQWGPEWICHNCLSFDMGWVEIETRGTIFSWERAWYPVHPALQKGLPYIVVLIELEQAGNIRMVGNLLGDPEQEVEIGASVEAVFEDHPAGDGVDEPYTLVQWSLAGS